MMGVQVEKRVHHAFLALNPCLLTRPLTPPPLLKWGAGFVLEIKEKYRTAPLGRGFIGCEPMRISSFPTCCPARLPEMLRLLVMWQRANESKSIVSIQVVNGI